MENKILSLYNKNFDPSVGYCKGNHMMLESYSHNMFYEPFLQSLAIILCFNYFHYFN
jgi:hypothetical protein